MKDETRQWLKYAAENLGAAIVVLDAGYLNACLQNCQQVVEKAMKSLLIEFALEFRKTHHIRELKGLLDNAHISVDISNDDCRFMDSIYLPSRYPVGGALPDAEPDREQCQHCLKVAERVLQSVQQHLKKQARDDK